MFRYPVAEKETKQFDAHEEKRGGKETDLAATNRAHQAIAAESSFGRADANEGEQIESQ